VSWSLYRWVWQLESPLFIGMPPSGSLNRCRLYVPARTVWGALTAELARKDSSDFPKYAEQGKKLCEQARFTYLFPAELSENRWVPWLPMFKPGEGLVWRRETQKCEPDRVFRSRLLETRPATAIEATADAAAEGSLRETECISEFWRAEDGGHAKPVGLVGCVFCRDDAIAGQISQIDRLFLGGDTRYGLGRVRKVGWEKASDVFGAQPKLDQDAPCVCSDTVWAHASCGGKPAAMSRPCVCSDTVWAHACQHDGGPRMIGALECLAGWDRADNGGLTRLKLYESPLWTPGSKTSGKAEAGWEITAHGFWQYHPQNP